MKSRKTHSVRLAVGGLLLGGALTVRADTGFDELLHDVFELGVRYTSNVEFLGLTINANATCGANCPTPAPDPNIGRLNFGLSSDGNSIVNSLALFEGQSQMVGVGTITSNGRACSTCHRPDLRNTAGQVTDAVRLGLPHTLPLSAVIPASDPLFTGRTADDGNHPDGLANLDNHGLVLIRPGRFNPLLAITDPFRQVIEWRKVPRFVNTGLTIGFVNDARMREVAETTRGAIFSHTQNFDERFDDLLRIPNPRYPAGPPDFEERPRNIAAFIESTTIDPPELRALLTPQDPTANPQCSNAVGAKCTTADCVRLTGSSSCNLATVLKLDPFFTVHATTDSEKRGQRVFADQCMGCHNTPNVFGSIEHIPGLPLSFPARYGHAFDVGVAQRNSLGLDFRAFLCADGSNNCPESARTKKTVVLPLAKVDGTTVMHAVTVDPGTASASGRYEDLFRFKVPQLRRVSQLGPYFHDNSAATLEAVLDHFTSDHYRNSTDGRNFPICLSPRERTDLLAFLRIL